MKIKLLFFLFALPALIFAQSIELEVNGPIPSVKKGPVFGNGETGIVRLFRNGKDLEMEIVNTKTLYTTSKKTFKSFFGDIRYVGVKILGEKIFLFTYFRDKTKVVLYSNEIDTKTGNLGKRNEISTFDSYINTYYSHGGSEYYGESTYNSPFKLLKSKNGDYLYVHYERNSDQKEISKHKVVKEHNLLFSIEANVFDINLNKVFEKQLTIDEPIKHFKLNDLEYDDSENTFYFSVYLNDELRGFVNERSEYFADEIDFEFSDYESLFDLKFKKGREDNVFAFGMSFAQKENIISTFSYNVKTDVQLIDKEAITIRPHPTFNNFFKKNFNVSGQNFREVSFNGAFINIQELNFRPNFYENNGGPSQYMRNNVFTKYYKDGSIAFTFVLPIADEVDGMVFDEICINANDNQMNVLYVDKFFDYKNEKGERFDREYLRAFSINNDGVVNDKTLFKKMSEIKSRNYFSCSSCIFNKENTISTYSYIKGKEDLILQVNFND